MDVDEDGVTEQGDRGEEQGRDRKEDKGTMQRSAEDGRESVHQVLQAASASAAQEDEEKEKQRRKTAGVACSDLRQWETNKRSI